MSDDDRVSLGGLQRAARSHWHTTLVEGRAIAAAFVLGHQPDRRRAHRYFRAQADHLECVRTIRDLLDAGLA